MNDVTCPCCLRVHKVRLPEWRGYGPPTCPLPQEPLFCPDCGASLAMPAVVTLHASSTKPVTCEHRKRGLCDGCKAALSERCTTCGEPYTVPPTRRAVLCSNGFHLCRDCTWSQGRRTSRCARHATPEMERAEILTASALDPTPETIVATMLWRNAKV